MRFRTCTVAVLGMAMAALMPMSAQASHLPESDAVSLEILADYYPGYWWDHTDITVAVQAAPNVRARHLAAVHQAIVTWDEVLRAPTDELVEVIRPGGLAPTKAPRIQHVLAEVHAATEGRWDLSFLGTRPLKEARDWLVSLTGIGRKTASPPRACLQTRDCKRLRSEARW